MRPREPRIVDLATYPKPSACLKVAADFLGMHEQTVKARIDSGDLPAWRDGKVYRILIKDLDA